MATESATLDIGSATSSNMTANVHDVTIPSKKTYEGVSEENDELSYINTNWEKQFGFYSTIPELKIAIDTRATWCVGKKYNTFDADTKVTLEDIRGWGQDTFQTILQNAVVVKRIGGDFFAEIVRNETTRLVNLKPLDPSCVKIVCSKKGVLKRYDYISKLDGSTTSFKPTDIFHLMNKRVGDTFHGTSDIDSVEKIIEANNEIFTDVRKLFHRFVKPICKFEVDTDDTSKINALVTKYDAIVEKGENLFIPKDTLSHELITIPSSSTLSPFQYMDVLKNYFWQTISIPQIILGSASEFSESSAKIAYLSFLQSLEEEQLYIENQCWNQLAIKIELDLPASLVNEMISDNQKDGQNAGMGMQPNDFALKPTNQEGGI